MRLNPIVKFRTFLLLSLLIVAACNPNQSANSTEQSLKTEQANQQELPGTQNEKYLKLGDDVYSWFKEEDFKSIADQFDESLKVYLDETRLKSTWQTLETQAGKLKDKGERLERTIPNFEEVLVQLKFEKVDLYMRIVVNEKGKIAGLFFQPNKV